MFALRRSIFLVALCCRMSVGLHFQPTLQRIVSSSAASAKRAECAFCEDWEGPDPLCAGWWLKREAPSGWGNEHQNRPSAASVVVDPTNSGKGKVVMFDDEVHYGDIFSQADVKAACSGGCILELEYHGSCILQGWSEADPWPAGGNNPGDHRHNWAGIRGDVTIWTTKQESFTSKAEWTRQSLMLEKFCSDNVPLYINSIKVYPTGQSDCTCPARPPTPAGCASGSGSQTVTAVGDPHLRNLLRQKFDIHREGVYTLVNVPRGVDDATASLNVKGRVESLGETCAGTFITEVSIRGKWLGEVPGITLAARQPSEPASFEAAGLQLGDVANLTTEEFIAKLPSRMVNIFVPSVPPSLPFQANKHVTMLSAKFSIGPEVVLKVSWVVEKRHAQSRFAHSLWLSMSNLQAAEGAIGGLLGVDDHEEAARPEPACATQAGALYSMAKDTADDTYMAIASFSADE